MYCVIFASFQRETTSWSWSAHRRTSSVLALLRPWTSTNAPCRHWGPAILCVVISIVFSQSASPRLGVTLHPTWTQRGGAHVQTNEKFHVLSGLRLAIDFQLNLMEVLRYKIRGRQGCLADKHNLMHFVLCCEDFVKSNFKFSL